jgi:serine/threonine protein kinase
MNNREARFEGSAQGFCLGDTPHMASRGEDVCRVCGALIQDVILGAYQVKRLLGSGRSGQAYLAVQQRQPQPVVVKVFPPDQASQNLWESAWHEANQLAALRHRSILPVLSCTLWNPRTHTQVGFLDKTADVSYLSIACQYAPVTLYTLLAPGGSGKLRALRLSTRHLLNLVLQASAALTLVHDLGIAHGALVPGNFLFSAQLDQLWLTDFGFARLHPPAPPFLAPELAPISEMCRQRRDMAAYWAAVTAASDQFSFATICYQLFMRATSHEIVERIVPVIQRASLPDPALRFPRIADFVSTLATVLASEQLLSGDPNASVPLARARITAPIQEYKYPGNVQNQGGAFSHSTTDKLNSSSAPLPTTTPNSNVPDGADHWEQVAGKSFAAHDYQGAEQSYLQATRLDPARASAWLGLGDTYFALERYTEALGAYGRALDLDPNNADSWFNRGTVLDVLGRTEQAALDYERADQLRAEASRRPE